MSLDDPYSKLAPPQSKLGAETGTAVYIRIASVALDARGQISDEEYARICSELDEVRGDMFNALSSMLIAISLMLTILAVATFNEVNLVSKGGGVAPTVQDDEDGYNDGDELSIWGPDAVVWLAPSNALNLRRGFYCAEFGLLAFGLFLSLSGVWHSIAQLTLFLACCSTGNVAMVEYLLGGGLRHFSTLYILMDFPFFWFALALPFIGARFNAVAFFTCIVVCLGCFAIWIPLCWGKPGGPRGAILLTNSILLPRAKAVVYGSDHRKSGS